MNNDAKTTDPMTDNDLAALEARATHAKRREWSAPGAWIHNGGIADRAMAFVDEDVPRLLAEVRRLRAPAVSDCANRATITVERTGGAFSIAANAFRVTLPNGHTSTIWSPPWNDGMPETETAGALKRAAEEWFAVCEAWQKQAEEDAEREHARREDSAEDRREARTLEREFLDGDSAREDV